MDEQFVIDIFMHFSDDMDPKMRDKFIELDRHSYYSVMVSDVWNPKISMAHEPEKVFYYSFRELYEQMCDLFWRFDEGDKSAMYDIFLLKNFVNYKMAKDRQLAMNCA